MNTRWQCRCRYRYRVCNNPQKEYIWKQWRTEVKIKEIKDLQSEAKKVNVGKGFAGVKQRYDWNRTAECMPEVVTRVVIGMNASRTVMMVCRSQEKESLKAQVDTKWENEKVLLELEKDGKKLWFRFPTCPRWHQVAEGRTDATQWGRDWYTPIWWWSWLRSVILVEVLISVEMLKLDEGRTCLFLVSDEMILGSWCSWTSKSWSLLVMWSLLRCWTWMR